MNEPAYVYRAYVWRVVDGDTVDLDVDMGFRSWRMRERIRLAGIDAPETRGENRAAGLASRAYLEELLPQGTEVILETTGKDVDNFGRWIGQVWLDDVCINLKIVADGHAVYRGY